MKQIWSWSENIQGRTLFWNYCRQQQHELASNVAPEPTPKFIFFFSPEANNRFVIEFGGWPDRDAETLGMRQGTDFASAKPELRCEKHILIPALALVLIIIY